MPEIFRHIISPGSSYAVWEITETAGELESMIKLRPAEKDIYQSFLIESRKKQWLAYRVLIRSMLSPEEFPVEYDDSGKPYLAGAKIHISVTHSGDLAGVIISSEGLVGIDLEEIRGRIEKVRERFLSPEELGGVGSDLNHAVLTTAWCAKEALYKLFGKRGLDFRKNIRLDLQDISESGEFKAEIRHEGKSYRFILHYRTIGNYRLVYVTSKVQGY